VYIVLDALDECSERKAVLRWIKQTTSWDKHKLHLLATSRPEEDIAENLQLLNNNHVNIKQDLVGRDTRRYINTILYDEDSFGQWGDEIYKDIKNTVLESAEGMYALSNVLNNDNLTVICSRFLLVSLQINGLQGCSSQGDLEDQSEVLPHDLD